ncbi:MAG: PPOX class F420-dependent oxidoreductase [Acidimicrobiales bacterium]
MTGPTAEELWRLVVEGRDGVLATINGDGTPHLSNIYYLADQASRTIRISTTTDRAKGRNLRRDPRAALHVSGADFVHFAVAQGAVTLAIAQEPGDAATDELFEVHRALGAASDRSGFDQEMLANHRMVVRLSVDRLYGLLIDR